jgi:hypothetical protein
MVSVSRVTVALALLAIGGCGRRAEHIERRVAAVPPQLWLVTVVGERHAGRSVRICVDDHLRSGFSSIGVSFGHNPCAHDTPQSSAWGVTYKCTVANQQFGVTTTIKGDKWRDFIAASTVTNLDASRTLYARALRFRYLGICPAGWPVGDATDQSGKREMAAFVGDTDMTAYPQN